jgi:hypothetical protein
MSPHSYATLLLTKAPKICNGEKTASFFNKCCWETAYLPAKKLKLDPCLSSCTSINSKWIKDLNIRPKTFQLVQESTENTLEAIGIGKDFLSRTQVIQQLRQRIDEWNYMKLKSFFTKK